MVSVRGSDFLSVVEVVRQDYEETWNVVRRLYPPGIMGEYTSSQHNEAAS
jgi:hypothetical protein